MNRMEIIHDMPCECCEMEAEWARDRGTPVLGQPNRTEAHHVVEQSYRKHQGGDEASIPLCGWHHRGEPLMSMTVKEMKFCHGPSLRLHKREFVALYGRERVLLIRVNRKIESRQAA